MERKAWWTIVHGVTESDRTEQLTLSLFPLKKKKNPAHCKGKQLGIHLDLGVK